VTIVGDVNRDGFSDFAAADLSRVEVYSGQDGKRLHVLAVQYYTLGRVVAGAGDIDRDGHDDVAATGGLWSSEIDNQC